jgi:hypothetical protein
MFSRGTMTAFARHICVRTLALRLGDIDMASRACLMAGEHRGPRGYFIQRCRSVMTVPAEALRHYSAADRKEDQ